MKHDAADCPHARIETRWPMGIAWNRMTGPTVLALRCRDCRAQTSVTIDDVLAATTWHGGRGSRSTSGTRRHNPCDESSPQQR